MTVYCVNYDLRKEGQNYENLIATLKKYPGGSPLKSLWLISTDQSIEQVYNALAPSLDKNDGVLVFKATRPFAHDGLHSSWAAWLDQYL